MVSLHGICILFFPTKNTSINYISYSCGFIPHDVYFVFSTKHTSITYNLQSTNKEQGGIIRQSAVRNKLLVSRKKCSSYTSYTKRGHIIFIFLFQLSFSRRKFSSQIQRCYLWSFNWWLVFKVWVESTYRSFFSLFPKKEGVLYS